MNYFLLKNIMLILFEIQIMRRFKYMFRFKNLFQGNHKYHLELRVNAKRVGHKVVVEEKNKVCSTSHISPLIWSENSYWKTQNVINYDKLTNTDIWVSFSYQEKNVNRIMLCDSNFFFWLMSNDEGNLMKVLI